MPKIKEGKQFETDIQKSCQRQHIKYLRLKDAPNSFSFGGVASSTIQYTQSSPYDAEIYKYPHQLCCELKSTKSTNFTLPEDEDDNKKMIKAKQVQGLYNVSEYKGVFPGFMFNFRENDNNTYFMSINSFLDFTDNTDKKSINESDIIRYKDTLSIKNKKLKVHYNYDIENLFEEVSKL
jgi:penicillin-binding protein-related factor A (putative recombinase)